MRNLLDRKAEIRKLSNAAEEQVKFLHNELSKINDEIKFHQSICSHTGVVYAEGRHGSDKGTLYYRCTKCSYEWDDD